MLPINSDQSMIQKQQSKKCFLCGEEDIRLLEKHHIFSRINSPEILLLCKNCHYKITHGQNKINPKRRNKLMINSEKEKYACLSVGILFQEIGNIIKTTGEVLLEISEK